MKKLATSAAFAGFLAATESVLAAGAPVNIAYPINGISVTNYFTSSFTTTCPGGQNAVKWYIDGVGIGSTTFYDTANIQFLHKQLKGWHELRVVASCGTDAVKFFVP